MGGRGRRQGLGMVALPSPHYIQGQGRGGGGAALALPPRKGAAREESILPKAPRRCLPPLGLFPSLNPRRMGLLGLVPLAHIGHGAIPTAHVAPPGQVAPPGGPPGPFRWSRYNTGDPETCPDGRNSTSYI